MIVKLIKDLEWRGKLLKEGRSMDVTQEFAQWLSDEGYIESSKKTKRTKKNNVSEKKQESKNEL
jgi:ribosomal protein S8